MKKFLLGFGCFLIGFSVFAVTQKGVASDKIAAIKEKNEAAAAKADTINVKVLYLTMNELLTADISSFDDAKKIQDKVAAQNAGCTLTNYRRIAEICATFYFRTQPEISKGAYRYAQEIGDYRYIFCQGIISGWLPKNDFTDKEILEICKNCLINDYMLTANGKQYTTKVFDKYIELTTKLDVEDAEVKTFLKKLNRIYSQQLITDKSGYEPIVAKIRTALDTY